MEQALEQAMEQEAMEQAMDQEETEQALGQVLGRADPVQGPAGRGLEPTANRMVAREGKAAGKAVQEATAAQALALVQVLALALDLEEDPLSLLMLLSVELLPMRYTAPRRWRAWQLLSLLTRVLEFWMQ